MYLKNLYFSKRNNQMFNASLVSRLLVPTQMVHLSATMPMTTRDEFPFFQSQTDPFTFLCLGTICFYILGCHSQNNFYQSIGPQSSRSKFTLRRNLSWWQPIPPSSSWQSILATSLLEGMALVHLIYLSVSCIRQKVAGNTKWMNEWTNEWIKWL